MRTKPTPHSPDTSSLHPRIVAAINRRREHRATDPRFGIPFRASCIRQNISPTYHRNLEKRGELVIFYDGRGKFVTLDSIVEREIRLLIASNPSDEPAPRPRPAPAAFRDGPRASATARALKKSAASASA